MTDKIDEAYQDWREDWNHLQQLLANEVKTRQATYAIIRAREAESQTWAALEAERNK